MVATVHAAENPRKMTVVSFGLFGDEGVFRREATGAAQIVANRFGGDPVVVKYNTKTGGSATVETLATTLQAEAKRMNGESDILFLNASSWNRVGDFGLVSRLCLLRSNPSVRSAPSFRPDLHARYADARSGGQGWPAFGPPRQRREASLTAASTTA